MRKWMAAAALGLVLTMQTGGLAFGADGTWIPAGDGWSYERPDGSMAKGTWEDIDGEWYYFGSDGRMAVGWQKIGNLRYYFNEDGALAEGWQCYTEDGDEKWYYYDRSGNAATGWLADGEDWYWFNGSGIMTADGSKTIGGKKYYFHEDGRLRANEYIGFKYLDSDGQANSEYNVRAENKNGGKLTVDDSQKEEIAEKLNAIPRGWLKKFADDGWKFIYCPEKEYYSRESYEDSSEKYYIRYKLSTSEKSLRFTDPDAIWAGFGEFVYRNSKDLLRDMTFSWEVGYKISEIADFSEVPESVCDDLQMTFGILFAEYVDEDSRDQFREELEDLCWIVEQVWASRNPKKAT